MFENETYNTILSRCLDNVSTEVDKREGSIIFDTISPFSLELVNLFISLDSLLDESFADTASREYLILRARERGISPKGAKKAVIKGELKVDGNIDVEIGTRFSLGVLNYTVISYLGGSEYELQCETAGEIGNDQLGKLQPIQPVPGLTDAKLTKILDYGKEEEDTETFRKRFFNTVQSEGYGGNRADYVNWAKAIDGVGQVKAYRAPDGGGTVEIIITRKSSKAGSEDSIENDIKKDTELKDRVKEILDPVKNEGEGEGIAPIGHKVSVYIARKRKCNVNILWELEEGLDNEYIESTKEQAREVIKGYIEEVNVTWEDKGVLRLYAAYILARLLDLAGVKVVTDVTVDNKNYISASEDQVFELGSVSFGLGGE